MAIDGENIVADFISFWCSGVLPLSCCLHGCQFGNFFAGQEVHCHIAAFHEIGIEFFEYDKFFPVVSAGGVEGGGGGVEGAGSLDVHRTYLTAILPGREIRARNGMGMIKPEPGGFLRS